VSRNHWVTAGLLVWYVVVSVWMAQAPADPQFWLLASILPGLFVVALIATYRLFPLSPASYALITVFLTLHTVGVHYTYAEVPVGSWLQQALHLSRNHFDRIVHFSFGFLLAYPLEEVFRVTGAVRGWLAYYLGDHRILGGGRGASGIGRHLSGVPGRCLGRAEGHGGRVLRGASLRRRAGTGAPVAARATVV
jgi:putative membrane protein